MGRSDFTAAERAKFKKDRKADPNDSNRSISERYYFSKLSPKAQQRMLERVYFDDSQKGGVHKIRQGSDRPGHARDLVALGNFLSEDVKDFSKKVGGTVKDAAGRGRFVNKPDIGSGPRRPLSVRESGLEREAGDLVRRDKDDPDMQAGGFRKFERMVNHLMSIGETLAENKHGGANAAMEFHRNIIGAGGTAASNASNMARRIRKQTAADTGLSRSRRVGNIATARSLENLAGSTGQGFRQSHDIDDVRELAAPNQIRYRNQVVKSYNRQRSIATMNKSIVDNRRRFQKRDNLGASLYSPNVQGTLGG